MFLLLASFSIFLTAQSDEAQAPSPAMLAESLRWLISHNETLKPGAENNAETLEHLKILSHMRSSGLENDTALGLLSASERTSLRNLRLFGLDGAPLPAARLHWHSEDLINLRTNPSGLLFDSSNPFDFSEDGSGLSSLNPYRSLIEQALAEWNALPSEERTRLSEAYWQGSTEVPLFQRSWLIERSVIIEKKEVFASLVRREFDWNFDADSIDTNDVIPPKEMSEEATALLKKAGVLKWRFPPLTYSTLPLEIRAALFDTKSFDREIQMVPGERISYSSIFTGRNRALVASDSELIERELRALLANPRQVTYDGEAHRFEDPELKSRIAYLAYALSRFPMEFKEAFNRLSEEDQKRLKTDSNTIDGSSRIEPFDLLMGGLKRVLFDKDWSVVSEEIEDAPFDFSELGTFQKSFFARMLLHRVLGDPSQKLSPIVVRAPFDPSIAILCPSPDLQVTHPSGDPITPRSSFFLAGYSLVQLSPKTYYRDADLKNWKGGEAVEISCAGVGYQILTQKEVGQGRLPEPSQNPLSKSRQSGQIRAVATLALVQEVTPQARLALIGFLAAEGFQPVGNLPVDDLRTDFLETIKKSDVFIPVGHGMNLNHFELGISSSRKLSFEKKGQPSLLLDIYLPDSRGKPIELAVLSNSEIVDMFCDREDKDGLAFFHLSCDSERNVDLWMSAFRQKIRAQKPVTDIGLVSDVPWIVGTKRGFDTGDPIETLSHFQHPLRFLSNLQKGLTLDETLADLKIERPPHPYVVQVAKILKGADAALKPVSFDPACNTDRKELFEMGGRVSFEVINLEDPTDRSRW